MPPPPRIKIQIQKDKEINKIIDEIEIQPYYANISFVTDKGKKYGSFSTITISCGCSQRD